MEDLPFYNQEDEKQPKIIDIYDVLTNNLRQNFTINNKTIQLSKYDYNEYIKNKKILPYTADIKIDDVVIPKSDMNLAFLLYIYYKYLTSTKKTTVQQQNDFARYYIQAYPNPNFYSILTELYPTFSKITVIPRYYDEKTKTYIYDDPKSNETIYLNEYIRANFNKYADLTKEQQEALIRQISKPSQKLKRKFDTFDIIRQAKTRKDTIKTPTIILKLHPYYIEKVEGLRYKDDIEELAEFEIKNNITYRNKEDIKIIKNYISEMKSPNKKGISDMGEKNKSLYLILGQLNKNNMSFAKLGLNVNRIVNPIYDKNPSRVIWLDRPSFNQGTPYNDYYYTYASKVPIVIKDYLPNKMKPSDYIKKLKNDTEYFKRILTRNGHKNDTYVSFFIIKDIVEINENLTKEERKLVMKLKILYDSVDNIDFENNCVVDLLKIHHNIDLIGKPCAYSLHETLKEHNISHRIFNQFKIPMYEHISESDVYNYYIASSHIYPFRSLHKFNTTHTSQNKVDVDSSMKLKKILIDAINNKDIIEYTISYATNQCFDLSKVNVNGKSYIYREDNIEFIDFNVASYYGSLYNPDYVDKAPLAFSDDISSISLDINKCYSSILERFGLPFIKNIEIKREANHKISYKNVYIINNKGHVPFISNGIKYIFGYYLKALGYKKIKNAYYFEINQFKPTDHLIKNKDKLTINASIGKLAINNKKYYTSSIGTKEDLAILSNEPIFNYIRLTNDYFILFKKLNSAFTTKSSDLSYSFIIQMAKALIYEYISVVYQKIHVFPHGIYVDAIMYNKEHADDIIKIPNIYNNAKGGLKIEYKNPQLKIQHGLNTEAAFNRIENIPYYSNTEISDTFDVDDDDDDDDDCAKYKIKRPDFYYSFQELTDIIYDAPSEIYKTNTIKKPGFLYTNLINNKIPVEEISMSSVQFLDNFDDIIKNRKTILINALAGYGKTYVIRQLLKKLSNVAIAAQNNIQCKLIHQSTMTIDRLLNIRSRSNQLLAKSIMLENKQYLIIDEVFMLSDETVEMLNKIRRTHKDLIILLFGDPSQLSFGENNLTNINNLSDLIVTFNIQWRNYLPPVQSKNINFDMITICYYNETRISFMAHTSRRDIFYFEKITNDQKRRGILKRVLYQLSKSNNDFFITPKFICGKPIKIKKSDLINAIYSLCITSFFAQGMTINEPYQIIMDEPINDESTLKKHLYVCRTRAHNVSPIEIIFDKKQTPEPTTTLDAIDHYIQLNSKPNID
jgi:hypothetical protein